ncbi:MAG: RNA polymerase sigma factor [Minisyncoccia bacterium]
MSALNGLEEKLLMKRVLAGEKEAFAEVYDFYVVKIFRFVYLKTNSKEVAEDITSEVFMKCWRHIKALQEKLKEGISDAETIGPLLYTIARNTVIDYYRKKNEDHVGISDEMKEKIADKRQNVTEKLIIKQEVEFLIGVIKELRDEYQEVLLLKFVEDLPNGEISQITGKSEGSTRVLIHRALKSLEKALNTKENIRNSK